MQVVIQSESLLHDHSLLAAQYAPVSLECGLHAAILAAPALLASDQRQNQCGETDRPYVPQPLLQMQCAIRVSKHIVVERSFDVQSHVTKH